jgi:[acyl-carrier-protein] S-malonyltransferase
MTVAFVFPGQGSQALGMGEDFFCAFPIVKARMEQASARLSIDLIQVIKKGPQSLLAKTYIAQPAIFSLSFALGELLTARGFAPSCVAGHSAGEFSAAAFAQTMPFTTGLDLITERGRCMHEVNESMEGAMLAVSGMAADALAMLLQRSTNGTAWVANYNAPSQIVISGLRRDLRLVLDDIVASGGRGTWLDVAGPYHSPLMKAAADSFAGVVDGLELGAPVCPLISNISAKPITDVSGLRAEFKAHMLSPVDWVGTLGHMRAAHVKTLVEVGPGRALKGLALRNDPTLTCVGTASVADFDQVCRRLEEIACESL